jgi:hypothetical protein
LATQNSDGSYTKISRDMPNWYKTEDHEFLGRYDKVKVTYLKVKSNYPYTDDPSVVGKDVFNVKPDDKYYRTHFDPGDFPVLGYDKSGDPRNQEADKFAIVATRYFYRGRDIIKTNPTYMVLRDVNGIKYFGYQETTKDLTFFDDLTRNNERFGIFVR